LLLNLPRHLLFTLFLPPCFFVFLNSCPIPFPLHHFIPNEDKFTKSERRIGALFSRSTRLNPSNTTTYRRFTLLYTPPPPPPRRKEALVTLLSFSLLVTPLFHFLLPVPSRVGSIRGAGLLPFGMISLAPPSFLSILHSRTINVDE
jgi:hypothetical protein